MSNVPEELRYLSSHEWVRVEGEEAVIGITDHAQDLLGDVVFVELPEEGATVTAGDEVAVVESVKAASEVYAPLAGEVLAINEALLDAPGQVNSDPYGDGWFFRIRMESAAEVETLLSAEAYADLCAQEDH